jgi:hypothetical protein
VANCLGLQIARTLVMNRRIRRAQRAVDVPLTAEAGALRRDGVVLIPRFLPDDVFAAVQAEYRAACEAGLLEPPDCSEDNGVVERRIRVGRHRDRFPATRRALLRDARLRNLAAAVVGYRPEDLSFTISIWSQSDAPPAPSRLIGSNYVHADVHFPTVKAWLYLNDVDESNAAMTYARGSNRLTLARLLYEYEASVRVAKAKAAVAVGQEVAYGRVRVPSAAQLARMGIHEEPLCGAANTLIVADTMGFHRRGTFHGTRTRDLLQINFNDRFDKASRPGMN